MPRPRQALLSPDVIADAAMALIDSGSPFGVNALARRLGVTASSLYHHVDGHDAIIELVRGRLVRRYTPDLPRGTWEEIVERTVRLQRAMYAGHPALVPLIVGKTITDEGVIEQYDVLATALVEGGFPRADVLSIVAVIDSFALGFGLDLASPENIWEPENDTRTLGALIADGPSGRERSDRAFEVGLAVLLDGLRSRLAASAPPDPEH
ncbi:TetR/AcrR family transcriptional regulator C-terminal domain-containing protein [Microbacterium sp. Yaish 1]|uniref:TetR/AcrR family transcriptional regulator C-terminal domain-containing protein n=1 Tax=Microbacterium sp. Yaish 1 TaxID=2025014 RepID=UPI0015C60777|nr:TetR/AcrR family transcriptional regulator C-terminal domain-containing protein [Microbacterium sp. Yaish 1]